MFPELYGLLTTLHFPQQANMKYLIIHDMTLLHLDVMCKYKSQLSTETIKGARCAYKLCFPDFHANVVWI